MHITKEYKFKIQSIKFENLNFLFKDKRKYYFDTCKIGAECKFNIIQTNVKKRNDEVIISFELNGLDYLDLDNKIIKNIIKKYEGKIDLKIYTNFITPAEDSSMVEKYYYEDCKVKKYSLYYDDPNVRAENYKGCELNDLINYFYED